MLGLYRDIYAGFTVKHFHEHLGKRHNYTLGYTVTKLYLHRAGLVQPATKRSAHRKKRPRRPMPGMMLHQDASRYAWLPGDERQHDLVVTMEDATSAIYSAFLVDEEGTASSFRGVGEVVDSTACSAHSILTGAVTTSTRPRAAAGVEDRADAVRPCADAARDRATSRRIRRRRAAVRSVRSTRLQDRLPQRTGGWPGSRRSRRPTDGSPRSTSRSTTSPSR